MVRALEEALGVTCPGVAEARAPMPAHVVMGAQFPIAIAAHDHGAACDLDDEEIAWRGDLAGDAYGNPRAREHLLALALEEALIGVRVGDQRRGEVHRQPRGRVGVLARERLRRQRALHEAAPGGVSWIRRSSSSGM